ncbi:hypothetical protein O181_011931 [Austropuccinia psidii MF-1]|uniref:Uncharacterized protein n=1 Tax=Austropuccinia psidii MF-1 TaxID=1389203 RepID=A0A9Q3BTN8_9BASI|nr:hypothetical protein [Austropuccinia psidii MF-1]
MSHLLHDVQKDGSDCSETGLLDWDRVGPPVLWDAPTGAGKTSVPSDSSSSTEFSSSSSPSSPGPLKMVLKSPGKPPTTPEKDFVLLGPLPSFQIGPLVEELLAMGWRQEERSELE